MTMTLEDLIYNRLIARKDLTDKLAKFNKLPAIFYQAAPGDKEEGWKGKKQYPRIDFVVDMQANPERQSSGLMTLNIWCDEAGTPPEEIEPEVRAVLCDVFMQPAEHPPYCLAWARSDSFEVSANTIKGSHVNGITILFDVLAFPCQETTDPDPIMAMNEFVKVWEPAAVLIGRDKIQDYFTAANDKPAFYFRLATLELAQETNTVAWMHGTIAGHVFAPSAEARLQWLKYLVDTLATQGEVTMLDTSPMFIRSIRADSAANYLMTGQIRINVRFGILRRPKYSHVLARTNIPREKLEEKVNVNVAPQPTAGYTVEYKLAGTDYEE